MARGPQGPGRGRLLHRLGRARRGGARPARGRGGIAAHVVDITSLDRIYRAWQRTLRQGVRTATVPSVPGALRSAFDDRAPVVTVHDAASHAMAWLGSGGRRWKVTRGDDSARAGRRD